MNAGISYGFITPEPGAETFAARTPGIRKAWVESFLHSYRFFGSLARIFYACRRTVLPKGIKHYSSFATVTGHPLTTSCDTLANTNNRHAVGSICAILTFTVAVAGGIIIILRRSSEHVALTRLVHPIDETVRCAAAQHSIGSTVQVDPQLANSPMAYGRYDDANGSRQCLSLGNLRIKMNL